MDVTEPSAGRGSTEALRPRRDLATTALPAATPDDWRDPQAAVQVLYDRAEAEAIEAIDWYLSRKRPKKRASRLLRAAAIVLGSAGAIEPVVAAPWLGSGQAEWGYLLLGGAAACVAFDRFFGISSGWMRCMQSAQRLHALVEDFQYDWAATYVMKTDSPTDVADRLTLLRTFTESVTQVVSGETGEWTREFSSNLTHLETQVASRVPAQARAESYAVGGEG